MKKIRIPTFRAKKIASIRVKVKTFRIREVKR